MTSTILLRRLSYANWLFKRLKLDAKKGGIAAQFSILGLHDCVELVLRAIAEDKSIDLPSGVAFMGYWSEFEKNEKPLSLRNYMERFNTSRKSLKHKGIMPDPNEVMEYFIIAEEFIRSTCADLLSVAWDSISLIDLIKSDNVRDLLRKAENNSMQHAYPNAIVECGNAFEQAMNEFYGKVGGTNSPYYMGRDPELYPKFLNVSDKIDSSTPIKDMPMQFNRVSNAVAVLCLGLEYDKYARFMNLIFQASKCFVNSSALEPKHNEAKVGESDANYCLDFAIDALICLQDKASL